jgi:hypothetical protein
LDGSGNSENEGRFIVCRPGILFIAAKISTDVNENSRFFLIPIIQDPMFPDWWKQTACDNTYCRETFLIVGREPEANIQMFL